MSDFVESEIVRFLENEYKDMPLSFNEKDIKEIIKKALMSNSRNLKKDELKKQAQILLKIFTQGMTPREAMDISKKEVSDMYNFAYSLFGSGQYAQAREMFRFLLMIEPLQGDFAIAQGVCSHRLKDYEQAATSYMTAATLNPKNPVPYFYAYDCFINLDNQSVAGVMLGNTITHSGDDPKYAQIKNKAEMYLETWLMKNKDETKNFNDRVQEITS